MGAEINVSVGNRLKVVFPKIPGAFCAGTSSDNTSSKFSVSSANNNQSDVSLPIIPIFYQLLQLVEKEKSLVTALWNWGNKEFWKRRATKISAIRTITVNTYTEGKGKFNDRETLKGEGISNSID